MSTGSNPVDYKEAYEAKCRVAENTRLALMKTLARVNRLTEAIRQAKTACLCERFDTNGFDYSEDHRNLGHPKPGKRWLTPNDILKQVLEEE